MLQVFATLILQAAVVVLTVWGMRKASKRDPIRLRPHNIDAMHITIATNVMVAVISILAYLLPHRPSSMVIDVSLVMIGFTLLMLVCSFTPPAASWFDESPIGG